MAKNKLGDPRRSQVIYNFGPGAIVDFRAPGGSGAPISVVVGGMEEWDRNAPPAGLLNQQIATEPRLQEQLGVKGFRLPPVGDETKDNNPFLIGVRFPRWLTCRYCHQLKPAEKWTRKEIGDPALYCGSCEAEENRPIYVHPAGFVVACQQGHLSDFPWEYYCHKGPSCESPELTLTQGDKIGLAGMILKCEKCGKRCDLEHVCRRETLKNMKITCHGNRPWLGDSEECKDPESNRVLLRGASNLYFPVTASALDIPPWSDVIQHRIGIYWEKLKGKEESKAREIIRVLELADELQLTEDEIISQIAKSNAAISTGGDKGLRYEEYRQLLNEDPLPAGESESPDFEIFSRDPPPELKPYFDKVVQAKRLREVRAIKSFTRILPPSAEAFEESSDFGAIQRGDNDWLPAIEVRGEGIFLTLNETSLGKWEEREDVKERAELINRNWHEDWASRHETDEEAPQQISARFILIHSLAHILIRQLSKECGYRGADMRERLYVGSGDEPSMAGLLIYTATPDSDGTLGGLVRQGMPGRVAELVPAAVQSAKWCSNDPLCIKDIQTFSDPLNLAACHSCLMASETTCEKFNRLLDRAFLVGLPDNPEVGYFYKLLSYHDEL